MQFDETPTNGTTSIMRATTRTLLFVSIILLFVVIAPLLVLYAKGYSFEAATREVVKTGMILLDTNVSKATVTVNDADPSVENDPILIRSLVPGTYHVRLEREGYLPWESDLTVVEERVTRVDDLVLVLEEPETQQPIADSIGRFAVSPNSRFIAYAVNEGTDTGLWLHTNGEQENRRLLDATDIDIDSIRELRWSQNSRLIMIRDAQNEYYNIAPHTGSPSLVPLAELSGLSSDQVKMDQDEPTTVFYREESGDVFRWRAGRTGTKPELIAKKTIAFAVATPKVFVLTESLSATQGGGLVLSSIDMRESDPVPSVVAQLPASNAELVSDGPTVIAALDDSSNLWLLDRVEGEFMFEQIATDVSRADWSDDGELLFYQTGQDLWIHDMEPLENESAEFKLTTLTEEPESLKWFPDGRHIVAASQTSAGTQLSLIHAARYAPTIQALATIPSELAPQFTRGGADLVYVVDKPTPGLILLTITEEIK